MASSPALVSNPRRRFLVFLSFRGEDTRKTFVSHLYRSLDESGVNTFRDDDKLERGAFIKSKLFEAIEESKLSIIIISENYASSGWCLEELSKILERQRHFGHIVLPVFYNVDPSDVRNLKGSFAEAFTKHEEKLKHEKKKVQIWKEALCEVGKIAGFDSRGRDESTLIKEIVNVVSHEVLSSRSVASDLVGVGPILKKIYELLELGSNDVRMLGIWGMGGIGKSTIAELVYERISTQFEAHYFFSEVKKAYGHGDLRLLQRELLSHLIKRDNIPLDTVLGGKQALSNTLSHRKVLIVLDDVDDSKQLEVLVGIRGWFGSESRIIITTRDKHLLVQYQVEAIYEVQGLNNHDAFELFTHYAFKEERPSVKFSEISMQYVEYCRGLPLALKVLGSFMFGKSMLEWQDEIKKLKKILNWNIYNVLKLSFDGLREYHQKELFLEIACFFNGWDRALVSKIMEAYGLFPYTGIRVLIDRSLVTIVKEMDKEIIRMHDLLQELGKQIVREESMGDLGMRSRLFDYEDVESLFTSDRVSQKVKGISLDFDRRKAGLKEIHASCNVFARMSNIRFLNLRSVQHEMKLFCKKSPCLPGECEVLCCKALESLPSNLKYLHWHGYPLSSLPSIFNVENLVILEMPCSPMKRLWKGTKCLANLIVLNLSYCQNLKKIPNLVAASKLEKLILRGCSALVKLHPSVQHLNNLLEIDLHSCEKLKDVPMLMGSLINLDLSSCVKIKKCPEISVRTICLTRLILGGTSIKELPSTIENLQKLKVLFLRRCLRLESVSSNICKLKSLRGLSLSGCPRFASFPDILEVMPSLKTLDLSGTAIKDLPSSIARLEGLRDLQLHSCKNLESICESESCCSNLQSLSSSLSNAESNVKLIEGLACTVSQLPSSALSNFAYLNLSRCNKLRIFSFLKHFSPFLCQVKQLSISDCHLNDIPREIGDLRKLRVLYMDGNDFKCLPNTIKQLSKLEKLYATRCRRLSSLPELPSSLDTLHAEDRTSLERLTTRPKHLIDLQRCPKLRGQHVGEVIRTFVLEKNRALITEARDKVKYSHAELEIRYSGSEIPEWIEQRSEGSSVSVGLPADVVFMPQLAFAFCVVLGFEELLKKPYSFDIDIDLSCNGTVGEKRLEFLGYRSNLFHISDRTETSDIVVVALKGVRGLYELLSNCNSLIVSFKFRQIVPYTSEEEFKKMFKVKMCGVSVFSHQAYSKKRRRSSSANEPKKKRRMRKHEEEEDEGLLVSKLSEKLEKVLTIQS